MSRHFVRSRAWQPYRRDRLRVKAAVDWREEIEMMLIEAGTDGVKQIAFTTHLSNYCDADQIVAHLEGLLAQNKVQKFLPITKRGRPPTIWRATTLIMED